MATKNTRKRKPRPDVEPTYSVAQLAHRYGTNNDAIREFVECGALEAIDIGRGSRPVYRFTQTQIDAFDRRRSSAASAAETDTSATRSKSRGKYV